MILTKTSEKDLEDNNEENLEDDLGLDDDNDLNDSFSDYGDSLTTAEKHSDLLKDLTDFDDYLKIKVTEWLGLIWSEDKKKYIQDPEIEPIMNMKGARWCVNFLRPYCRNNNIITSLDKDTYLNMMDDIIETSILNIGTRMSEFEIKTNAEAMSVWNQLIHSAELVLVGAGGSENYKKMLQTTIQRNESMSINNLQQQQQPQNQPTYMQKIRKLTGI